MNGWYKKDKWRGGNSSEKTKWIDILFSHWLFLYPLSFEIKFMNEYKCNLFVLSYFSCYHHTLLSPLFVSFLNASNSKENQSLYIDMVLVVHLLGKNLLHLLLENLISLHRGRRRQRQPIDNILSEKLIWTFEWAKISLKVFSITHSS